jgi:hypothetical protein
MERQRLVAQHGMTVQVIDYVDHGTVVPIDQLAPSAAPSYEMIDIQADESSKEE